jgi:hypothetical protein
VRDVALITVMMSGLLRSSEAVDLDAEDATFCTIGAGGAAEHEAARLRIKRSKTDQAGDGRTVTIRALPDQPQTCPVTLLRRW